MDRRDRSLISLITILPPTSLAPGTQWFARYSSTGAGSAHYPIKNMGAPLFESLIMKYTYSNSMLRIYITIWNPFFATFHILIICSRRRTFFFNFCILTYLRRPKSLNVDIDQGLHKAPTSSSSCSLSFHSSMIVSKITCNH
jgi:hypothetical protein